MKLICPVCGGHGTKPCPYHTGKNCVICGGTNNVICEGCSGTGEIVPEDK